VASKAAVWHCDAFAPLATTGKRLDAVEASNRLKKYGVPAPHSATLSAVPSHSHSLD
jgi:hypothetical protein